MLNPWRKDGTLKAGRRNRGDSRQQPEEALVQILVNEDFLSSILCTPIDLTEMAVGWLYNQGFIESIDEVASVDTCERKRKIYIDLTTERYREREEQGRIRTSACTGGEISYFQFTRRKNRLREGPRVTLGRVQSLVKETLAQAREYERTGGIHCASLVSVGLNRIVAQYEDVGRHNAIDKVVGRMLLKEQDPEDKMLLTSGRISSEMALKAVHSGITVIASITTCTDLALEIAEEAGLTVITRALKAPRVLSGAQRIRKHLEDRDQAFFEPCRTELRFPPE
ncbi:MAG: formate dehydrogenase family accessory protein FdhD [Deltaproteobacteria bacterium HGW-Deltaproteobacteria-15]|jgi:FdhD protein|nr:MAG: formate dehydrogenase family accessory protein FdhD [Deltaproteobacteria bacterium HGW-Deltaproteobacteria-15]